MKQPIQIVWLKRDLRTQDHHPLALAEASGEPYVVLFLLEPSMLQYPDCSAKHLQFQLHDHFVQKFENRCSYEVGPIDRAYEGMKFGNNKQFLRAWGWITRGRLLRMQERISRW